MDRNIDFSEYDLNQKTQKGISLFDEQEYSECFDIFKSIIQKNPKHYDANLWLGKTYVAQKSYYNAKSQFERCLEIDPSNIEPLTERKEMNYEQKNWRDYVADMEGAHLSVTDGNRPLPGFESDGYWGNVSMLNQLIG